MNGRPILVDLLLDTITLFMIMIMIELASGSTGKHRPSYSYSRPRKKELQAAMHDELTATVYSGQY